MSPSRKKVQTRNKKNFWSRIELLLMIRGESLSAFAEEFFSETRQRYHVLRIENRPPLVRHQIEIAKVIGWERLGRLLEECFLDSF